MSPIVLIRRPLQAISLLTRLPVRVRWEEGLRWGSFAGCFPLAGWVVGAILFLPAWMRLRLAPDGGVPWPGPLATAALLLGLWAWATGALHLDGWADTCDGCFTAASREKRLAIMADPRLGGFGVTGLSLFLLLKFAATASLSGIATASAPPFALLAAPVAARWGATLALCRTSVPLANPAGMAARMREGLTTFQPILATLFLAPLFLLDPRTAAIAVLASLGTTTALLAFAKRQLGGITGDILGAIIELSEAATLLAAA